jgi:hypothetical protein
MLEDAQLDVSNRPDIAIDALPEHCCGIQQELVRHE